MNIKVEEFRGEGREQRHTTVLHKKHEAKNKIVSNFGISTVQWQAKNVDDNVPMKGKHEIRTAPKIKGGLQQS